MTVKATQLETPFTQAQSDKLATIEPGAQAQPATASQAEAEAGIDNIKMMTPLRVKQSITANGGGGGGGGGSTRVITDSYSNNTGNIIFLNTVVSQDSSGNMISANCSSETNIQNILGILTQDTPNLNTGLVASSGVYQNISGFSINDILYLTRTGGSLTTQAPDIGVNGFVSGDFVVKVGKITKNSSNPSNHDLLLAFEIIGQL